MPQMSPLGWAWMVVVVVFGYYLFFLLVYYLYFGFIFFNGFKMKFSSFYWVW